MSWLGVLLAALLTGAASVVLRGRDPAMRVRATSVRDPAPPAVGGFGRRAGARLRAVGWFGRGTGEVVAVRGFVEAWAAGLRSGRPIDGALRDALDDLPAVRPLLRRTALTLTMGGDVSGAVSADARALTDASAHRALLASSACWSVAHRHGGRLADALDRVGAAIRADELHAAHVRAQLAGPRSTARLLAVLPLLALVMASSLGIGAWQVLLSHPIGRGALVAGLGLDALGLWWTSRLARAAERSA